MYEQSHAYSWILSSFNMLLPCHISCSSFKKNYNQLYYVRLIFLDFTPLLLSLIAMYIFMLLLSIHISINNM